MKTTMTARLNTAFATVFLLTTGCISIDIKPKEFHSADQIQFKAPEKPFKEINSMNSDRSWKSSKTENVISFVSECGAISGMKLKAIASSVVEPTGMKIEKQESAKHSGNPILITYAVLTEDSEKKTRLKLVTEKTSQCIYNFAYLASQDTFSAEEAVFDQFLERFKSQ